MGWGLGCRKQSEISASGQPVGARCSSCLSEPSCPSLTTLPHLPPAIAVLLPSSVQLGAVWCSDVGHPRLHLLAPAQHRGCKGSR